MFSWFTGDIQFEQLLWARPLPVATLVAAALGVLIWSLFLYRRRSGLRSWQRLSLTIARIVVLALAVLTLMEPTAVLRETRTHAKRLPVLLDASASMSIQDQRKRPADLADAAAALGMLEASSDADAEQVVLGLDPDQRQAIATASRLDLAKALLTQTAKDSFATLSETLDVKVHSFGETLSMLGQAGDDSTGALIGAVQPDARQTALVQALEAIARPERGAAPAGIVLLSDGIENAASARSEALLRELGTRGVPVYPVPIGLADPDDISIRHIVMQDVAFSGDRVPVRVQIKSRGYEKRGARLSVLINDRRVSQRTVDLRGGLQFEDIDFRVDVYEKGAVRVDVKLDAFEDEVSDANNAVRRSIRVVNEKVKVLYVEGSARWEFRYLQAILKRDPRIEATFIASSVGPEMARNSPEHIERFPSQREEAFVYDLVILGDVDPAFFSDEELALLEEMVRDRGASLLVLCGAEYTPAAYGGTVVESLLPTRFDADGEWEDVDASVYPVLTPEGVSSMVMTLEDDRETNERIWSRMAPLDRVPPLLSPKLGATVLVGLSDTGSRAEPYPLIAWQRYGTGKCMSIATDRLWRLRFKAGDKYHWRVWSQCMQFMTLSRLLGEHKPIRLETDRSIYPIGEQVRLYAHVLDEDFEAVQQPRFDVQVMGLGDSAVESRVSLRPVRSEPGMYEGYFSPPAAGRYRLDANIDDRRLSNSIEFQVSGVERELLETGASPAYLARIAELSGGQTLRMSELSKLTSLVDREPVITTVRLERPLWNNWGVALLFIGLAGMEWLVRRRHDLP